MKKTTQVLALLMLISISVFGVLFIISPNVFINKTVITIFYILLASIIPIILIAKACKLLNEDYKYNLAKINIIISVMTIVLIIIKNISNSSVIELPCQISISMTIFLIIYSIINETKALSKFVSIYQIIISLYTFGLIIYINFMLKTTIKFFNLLSLNNFYVPILLFGLDIILIISIPIINYLFKDKPIIIENINYVLPIERNTNNNNNNINDNNINNNKENTQKSTTMNFDMNNNIVNETKTETPAQSPTLPIYNAPVKKEDNTNL